MARSPRHDSEIVRCSFCRVDGDAVDRLISSPSDYPRAYICDRCVQLCESVLQDEGCNRPQDGINLIKERKSVPLEEALQCSFCHKAWGSGAGNLISGPGDASPRVYICDECIAVCAMVIDPGKRPVAGPFEPPPSEAHLTAPLLAAVYCWIGKESLGVDAAEELAALREIARRWAKRRP